MSETGGSGQKGERILDIINSVPWENLFAAFLAVAIFLSFRMWREKKRWSFTDSIETTLFISFFSIALIAIPIITSVVNHYVYIQSGRFVLIILATPVCLYPILWFISYVFKERVFPQHVIYSDTNTINSLQHAISDLRSEVNQIGAYVGADQRVKIKILMSIAHQFLVLRPCEEISDKNSVLFLAAIDSTLHLYTPNGYPENDNHKMKMPSWHTIMYCYMQRSWVHAFKYRILFDEMEEDEQNNPTRLIDTVIPGPAILIRIPNEKNLQKDINIRLNSFLTDVANKAIINTTDLLTEHSMTIDGIEHLYDKTILGVRLWFASPDNVVEWFVRMKQEAAVDPLFQWKNDKKSIINLWLPAKCYQAISVVALTVSLGKKPTNQKNYHKNYFDTSMLDQLLSISLLFRKYCKVVSGDTYWFKTIVPTMKTLDVRADKHGINSRHDIFSVGHGLGFLGMDDEWQKANNPQESFITSDDHDYRKHFIASTLTVLAGCCAKQIYPFYSLFKEASQQGVESDRLNDALRNIYCDGTN